MSSIFINRLPLFFIVLSTLFYFSSAYDFGCQYIWEGPDPDHDLQACAMKIPTENPGVLIPPLIPLTFMFLLIIIFPIVFFCRECCGCCGSNRVRPSAGCCGGGKEWDDVDNSTKLPLYPQSYVCCIKISCVIVCACAIVPIILMPLGAVYGKEFWDGFFDSANTDVIDWVETRKNEFQNDLRLENGSYIHPLNENTFEGFDNFTNNTRTKLNSFNDKTVKRFVVFYRMTIFIATLPLVSLLFLIVFMFCHVRRIFPAICSCWYFILSFLAAGFCCFLFVLGVAMTLSCGEVRLQQQMRPGVFQWYLVPLCEKKAFFNEFKSNLYDAERKASVAACEAMVTVCDGKRYNSIAEENNYTSRKPFYCPTLKKDSINATCQNINIVGELFNTTFNKKQGLLVKTPLCDVKPEICNFAIENRVCGNKNCSLWDCPEECDFCNKTVALSESASKKADEIRNKTREGRDKIKQGMKVVNALSRAFVYAECDPLITQFIQPFHNCRLIAAGMFVGGAGAGIAAVLLMLGILLMFKGEKVFFSGKDMESKETPTPTD